MFIFTTNVYAIDSTSTFEEIVKQKSEIPTDILIKKKNGKYGILDKKTKEILIPYEYKSISKLGIDTVLACSDYCSILTNNNISLFSNVFSKQKKVKTIKIDKNKPKDITNTIFYEHSKKNRGLLYHVIIPSYPSSKFFKDYIDTNNKFSNFKFKDYPINDNIALLFKKNDNIDFVLQRAGEGFKIYNYFNINNNLKNKKKEYSYCSEYYLISQIINIAYCRPSTGYIEDVREEIEFAGENVIIKFNTNARNFHTTQKDNSIFIHYTLGDEYNISYIKKTAIDSLSENQKKIWTEFNKKRKQEEKVNTLGNISDSALCTITRGPFFIIFYPLIRFGDELMNQMFPEPGNRTKTQLNCW